MKNVRKHGENFTCSGVLIDSTTVLTTAKCLLNEGFYPSEIKKRDSSEHHYSGYRVYLGVHDIRDVLRNRLRTDTVQVGVQTIHLVK